MNPPDPLRDVTPRRTIEDRVAYLRPLVLEFNLLRLTVMALDIAQAGPRTKVEHTFAAVHHAPGSTAPEIAALIQLSANHVETALETLSDKGLAHRIAQRWFPGPRDLSAYGVTGDMDEFFAHADDPT